MSYHYQGLRRSTITLGVALPPRTPKPIDGWLNLLYSLCFLITDQEMLTLQVEPDREKERFRVRETFMQQVELARARESFRVQDCQYPTNIIPLPGPAEQHHHARGGPVP